MLETGYLIWPDGMPYRHTIRSRFEREGLVIVESACVRVTPGMLDVIYPPPWYPAITPEARQKLKLLIRNGECEMGILTGPNAIKKVRKLVGAEGDPALCKEATIRRDFGVSTVEYVGEFPVHYKVIHRSRNPMEARRDVKILRHFMASKR